MSNNELFIYGIISSSKSEKTVTSLEVREFLSKADKNKPLIVRLNSPGGEIAEGVTIHNMLERFNDDVHVYIDGLAASIASVIAMSGSKIFMARNASLMIHNASTGVSGNSQDLRRMAEVLDKMNTTIKASYSKRELSITDEELTDLMTKETWLTADEALKNGFVDEIVGATKHVAYLDSLETMYNNIPDHLKGGENLEEEEETVETTEIVTKEDFDALLKRVEVLEELAKPEEEEQPEEEAVVENKLPVFFF